MGKVGFGRKLAMRLVTQQRPTPSQVRVFESVLVALADHGFTPTAIAARLTYLSAPDSLQGAMAAACSAAGRASGRHRGPRDVSRPMSSCDTPTTCRPISPTTPRGSRWL